MLRDGELLIYPGNEDLVMSPMIDGEVKMRGLEPRDWEKHPCGSIPGAPMTAIPKIPRSEWDERIRDLVAGKALLSDIRLTHLNGNPIPSRDQNGRGYCWAHSTVSAAIMARASSNLPFADLSAYAIACIIKGYRDQGGWNAESMKFIRERGCPTSATWAQKSVNRANDNPNTWEEAAKYKMTEWEDIPDRDFDQLMTMALLGIPCALDLNWWRHSIGTLDPVSGAQSFGMTCRNRVSGKLMDRAEFDRVWQVNDFGAAYGIRIWNSWADSWSDRGMGVLTESKARPDGAIACRVMKAAA